MQLQHGSARLPVASPLAREHHAGSYKCCGRLATGGGVRGAGGAENANSVSGLRQRTTAQCRLRLNERGRGTLLYSQRILVAVEEAPDQPSPRATLTTATQTPAHHSSGGLFRPRFWRQWWRSSPALTRVDHRPSVCLTGVVGLVERHR